MPTRGLKGIARMMQPRLVPLQDRLPRLPSAGGKGPVATGPGGRPDAFSALRPPIGPGASLDCVYSGNAFVVNW